MTSVSSEEFSFPSLASHNSSQLSVLDSPPLWKPSPDNSRRKYYVGGLARLVIGNEDDNDQRNSFSCVDTRSLWSDTAEEKMDMLWEDLNEELPPRSQSKRIEPGEGGGVKKSSVFSDETSDVAVGCGMKLTKKMQPKNKKNPNVLVLMRLLKKLLVLRSSSQRSPEKTHPR